MYKNISNNNFIFSAWIRLDETLGIYMHSFCALFN